MNKNDRNMKRQQRFIKVVSRRMAKAGFECKMVDNHFVVIVDGKPFEVEMWDTPGWGRRRVHFNLSFACEGMDQVMIEGLMWLTSECNNHSDYTTTRFLHDHFSCCVETTVRTAKEFMREFAFASKQLGFTYQNLNANYSHFCFVSVFSCQVVIYMIFIYYIFIFLIMRLLIDSCFSYASQECWHLPLRDTIERTNNEQ